VFHDIYVDGGPCKNAGTKSGKKLPKMLDIFHNPIPSIETSR
jgi:hypothetical protein